MSTGRTKAVVRPTSGATALARARGDIRIARTMRRTPIASADQQQRGREGDHQLDGEPAVQDPAAERRRVRLADRETFGDLHRGEERGLQRHQHQGQPDGRRAIDAGEPAPKPPRERDRHDRQGDQRRLDQDRPQRRALVPEPDRLRTRRGRRWRWRSSAPRARSRARPGSAAADAEAGSHRYPVIVHFGPRQSVRSGRGSGFVGVWEKSKAPARLGACASRAVSGSSPQLSSMNRSIESNSPVW